MTGAMGSTEAQMLRQALAECQVVLGWNRRERRERGFKHTNKQLRERATKIHSRLQELARPEAKPVGPPRPILIA